MSDSQYCCWSRAQKKIPTLPNPSFGFILQNTVIPFSNESRFGLRFVGLTILKIDQIHFKLIFYSSFSFLEVAALGCCLQQQRPAGTDPSKLQEHWAVMAELLLAVRAVGRLHTQFVILWQNVCGFVLMSSCLAGTVCCGLPALRNAQCPAHEAS